MSAKLTVTSEARVLDGEFADRLEITGRTSMDTVAVVLPAGSTQVWLNGRKISAGDALALPPERAFAAWCSEDTKILLVFLPVHTLETTDFLDRRGARLLLSGKTLLAEQHSPAYDRLSCQDGVGDGRSERSGRRGSRGRQSIALGLHAAR
jgi:hypothetical protein